MTSKKATETTPEATEEEQAATETTPEAIEEEQAADDGPVVEAFILSDCQWGKCGTVADVPKKFLNEANDRGVIDTNKKAIAAAKSTK